MIKRYLSSYLILVLLFADLFLTRQIFQIWRQLQLVPAEVFVVEEYRPADIEVDLAISRGTIKPIWQSFAQGGEELGGNMLTPTVGSMAQLNPRYVRLDHIFDDDYYGVVKGPGQYDFSRLDAVVNQILAMGAKPFFCLSYMPSAFAETKISSPRNWDDWYSLVRATVEHYSSRSNRNLSDIYYEVWNEPDLEQFGGWQRSGGNNYLTLYSVSARAAVAAVNTNRFYIGGPATTGLYRNWIIDLINFTASNNLRLDFLSWHRYSYSPQQYLYDFQQLEAWLGGTKGDYQWIISEWGPTPEKSGSYASTYALAHAFAVVRQGIDILDGMYAFEIKDGPSQSNQGWGLLGHESAGLWKKPRFAAFSWLKDAWGQRMAVRGEGSNITGWAVKREDGVTDLYLGNFAASGAREETVPVKFINLQPGEFEIMENFLVNKNRNNRVMASTISGRLFITLQIPPNEVVKVSLKPL